MRQIDEARLESDLGYRFAYLTEFMGFRGPDAQGTWVSGSIGLGHAMLRTTRAAISDRQPCGVDGLWIVADCRLDARSDLLASLQTSSKQLPDTSTDAELIAHAYLKWGTACAAHLLGDFAFAIWDAGRRQLFCARDHLGVKPFYYAHRNDVFLFSNTLECLRQHPCVSDALDDRAIGDFLLFDRICDTAGTAFEDIRRLPAAHSLTISPGGLKIARYWSVPTDGHIRYRDSRDYGDHFQRIFSLAVGDRLSVESAGMMMSGGVDSTAVATMAHRLHAAGTVPALRGYTFVYDRLLQDDERYYAGLGARALGMPIEFLPLDDYALYERCFDRALRKPEPHHWPLDAATQDLYRHISGSSRVVLTGEGGDPLSYFGSLLCTPRFHTLLPQAAAYVLSRRRCLPLGLRTTARRIFGGTSSRSDYPGWLNETFAARMDLPGRFEQIAAEAPAVHPTHAKAHAMLSNSSWATMFEGLDPGTTRLPLEFRHPIFDVRLIEYVLSIPLIPWSVEKELLRSVSTGVQPDEVRLRRKSPLNGDPIAAHLKNGRPAVTEALTAQGRLTDYVNLDEVQRGLDDTSGDRWWADLRPVSLNLWLKHAG